MLATSVSLFVSVSALALHHRAEGFAAPHAAVSPRRRGGGRIPVVTPDLDRHGDGGSSVALVTYGFALQASAGGGGGDDFASFASNLDPPPTSRSSRGSTAAAAGWKDDLDELLGLSASPVRRQVLLQKLLNSNQEIRDAVESALREGKIDPLLTPTGKKWQDGTRAVARQVTTDILPQLTRSAAANANANAAAARGGRGSGGVPSPAVPPSPLSLLPRPPDPADLSKVGTRVLNLLQQQAQRNLEFLQQDLADPVTRIPKRLSEQTTGFIKEAQNVFSETPAGLQEPRYTLVSVTDDYEIRDYEGYQVASTPMSTDEVSDWTQTGAAFNTLAGYLFGGNAEGKVMDMTTPVTTTMSGEMRFYLTDPDVPAPFESQRPASSSDRKGTSGTSAGSTRSTENPTIEIQTLPPARLAVRRFTGFVTDGEVSRQKEALLTALSLDGVELDVPHGQAVPHAIFQYNPPYALPVIRRNEIAVPVVGASDELEAAAPWNQDDPWAGDSYDDSSE